MAWIHGGEGYWQTESSRKILYWTIAAVAVPSVGFVVWWITEKSFNRFAPFQVMPHFQLYNNLYVLKIQ